MSDRLASDESNRGLRKGSPRFFTPIRYGKEDFMFCRKDETPAQSLRGTSCSPFVEWKIPTLKPGDHGVACQQNEGDDVGI